MQGYDQTAVGPGHNQPAEDSRYHGYDEQFPGPLHHEHPGDSKGLHHHANGYRGYQNGNRKDISEEYPVLTGGNPQTSDGYDDHPKYPSRGYSYVYFYNDK